MGNGIRNLRSNNILDTEDANDNKSSLLDCSKDTISVHILMTVATLICLQVFIGKANSSEGHCSHLSDNIEHVGFHLVSKGSFLAISVKIEVATLKNLLGCTFHMAALIITKLSGTVILSQSRHSLSL